MRLPALLAAACVVTLTGCAQIALGVILAVDDGGGGSSHGVPGSPPPPPPPPAPPGPPPPAPPTPPPSPPPGPGTPPPPPPPAPGPHVTAASVVGAPNVAGCVRLDYTLAHTLGQRTDVVVEHDPDGAGPQPFRRSALAGGAPGEGIYALAASAAGTPHVFLWNSALDLPQGGNGVTLRVRPAAGGTAQSIALNVRTQHPALALQPQVTVSTGPSSVAVGDLDRDGDEDAVVVHTGVPAGLRVVKNDGAGGLSLYAPGSVNPPTIQRALEVALGDLNRDGILDFVTVDNDTGEVHVGLGNGSGGWSSVTSYPAGTTSFVGMALGDLDRDGDLDVVCSDNNPRWLWLANDGAGGLGAPTIVANPLNTVDVAVGDVNRDGWLDVVTFGGDQTLLVYPGPGFGAPGSVASLGPAANNRFVTLGDLDRDGDLDAATVSHNSAHVEVHLGNGTLTFGAGTRYATPVSAYYAPAFADLDGDGVLDIVVGSFAASNQLWVFTGDGAGGFGPRVDITVATNVIAGAVPADLNGDGKLDLLSWQLNDLAVRALLNARPDRCDPGLAGAELLEAHAPGAGLVEDVVAADLDGDGKHDLACAAGAADRVAVFRGSGSGAFSPAPGSPLALAGNPVALTASDVDADGTPDLAIVCRTSAQVALLRGQGGAAFAHAPGSPFAVGGDPVAVAAGRIDGDALPDLVVVRAGPAGGDVRTFRGAGGGAFTPWATLTAGGISTPRAAALGDIDGDQDLDLVVGNDAGSVSVLLGDGTGAFAATAGSPIALPGATGLARVLLADRDGDGDLDLLTANAGTSNVSLLLGDKLGGFAPAGASPFATGAAPRGLALALLNGDATPDLIVAAGGGAVVLLGTGPASHGAPAAFSAGGGAAPRSIAAADVSSDGQLDVVVACGAAGTLALLRGDGAGALGATPATATGQTAPGALEVGDLAGPGGAAPDGRLDLAVSDASGASGAALLVGDGAGGLAQASGSPTAALDGRGLAIADVKGPAGGQPDGRPDLVVSQNGAGSNALARVFHGPGLGTNTSHAGPLAAGPRGVAVADMNRDGLPDLVQVSANTGLVSVYLGHPATPFATRIDTAAGGLGAERLLLLDVDRDGDVDVVTVNRTSSTLSVLRNDGTGALSAHPASPFATGAGPFDLALADLDRDGDADVLVSVPGSGVVQRLSGSGVGGAWTLGAATTVATLDEPAALQVADVTGDGRLDLIVTDPDSGPAQRGVLHLLSGDGAGAFPARRLFATGRRPVALAVGDLARDGKLDLATANETDAAVSLLRGR